jgi:hypothetical protein
VLCKLWDPFHLLQARGRMPQGVQECVVRWRPRGIRACTAARVAARPPAPLKPAHPGPTRTQLLGRAPRPRLGCGAPFRLLSPWPWPPPAWRRRTFGRLCAMVPSTHLGTKPRPPGAARWSFGRFLALFWTLSVLSGPSGKCELLIPASVWNSRI